MIAGFPENIAADFQHVGKRIDAVDALTEGLLGFFDGRVGSVESLLDVAGVAQRLESITKDADEVGGGRVHLLGVGGVARLQLS